MMTSDQLLYDHLLELEVLETPMLESVWDEAKRSELSLAENLMHHGLVTSQTIVQLMADVLHMSPVFFSKVTIETPVVKMLPFEFMLARHVFPFRNVDGEYHVAVSDPDDREAISQLKKFFTGNCRFFYTLPEEIEQQLSAFSPSLQEEVKSIYESSATESSNSSVYRQLVSAIIYHAHQENVSDIHLEAWDTSIMVRFRIDGILHDILEVPEKYTGGLVRRIKVLAHLPTDKFSEPLDGTIHDRQRHLNMRVSVMPVRNGEKVVLRLLRDDKRQLHLSELGLRAEDEALLKKSATRSDGMILTVGPTGSGKTTTLYALLQLLNSPEVNITTIEDPIEYDMSRVNQIQVNADVNLSFSRGLRSIVRQDPDVILVGEIRDTETADIAVNAALTGHLLLSTLHASTAAVTIPRLVQLGVEPYLVSTSILAVVSQRLVRKLCVRCRLSVDHEHLEQKVSVPSEWKERLESLDRTYTSKGCEQCKDTGFVGRTGVYEVMVFSESIREAVVSGADADTLQDLALQNGMHTMIDDGLEKVSQGITSVAELIRVFGQKE